MIGALSDDPAPPLKIGDTPRPYGLCCATCLDTGWVHDNWDRPTMARCPRKCVTRQEDAAAR